MPINIHEFEEGPGDPLSFSEGTQPHTILTFLLEHDEQAFTTPEIAERTEIPQDSARTVLHRLLDRGLVRHRGRYWAIGADDRLASQAAQEAASSASTTDDYYS
jgi:response regulator of citrate/malate metabolism